MQLARPSFAPHPTRFGKARLRALTAPHAAPGRLADDLKLFVTTFLAGFVVVSVLIG